MFANTNTVACINSSHSFICRVFYNYVQELHQRKPTTTLYHRSV